MKLPPRITHTLALVLLFALQLSAAPSTEDASRNHSSIVTTVGARLVPAREVSFASTSYGLADAGGDKPRPYNPEPRSQQQPAKNKRESKTQRRREPDTRARREQAQAVAALREAAEAVRDADDLFESVRLRALVAEVLWPHDAATARATLRRTWEDATAPGAVDRVEGLGYFDDESRDARHALTVARRYVVKTALKHDPPLAEEFMRQFARTFNAEGEATSEVEGVEAASPSSNADDDGPRTLSNAGGQRFAIAAQLLAEGDVRSAVATAAPLVAEGPTPPLLEFIARLRATAPSESDALYLRLLEHTRADATANVNDLLLLSAPVVSPTLLARLDADGSVSFGPVPILLEEEGAAAPPPPSAAVRRAFFHVAASVLTRPRANAGGDPARRSAEAARLYFTAARLLPFFDREAPQHAPALHALMAALAAELEASRREALADRASVMSLTPKNPVDVLAPLANTVADATSANERDWARFELVMVAARHRLWDRARTAAAEIEDEATRRDARRALSMAQVLDTLRAFDDDDARPKRATQAETGTNARDDKNEKSRAEEIERAASFVRAADVPPEVCAAGFAQAAELAAKRGQRARAAELLAEAATRAGQTDRDDSRRTLALALVALSAARVQDASTWDALSALVRSADEDEALPYNALDLDYIFEHFGHSFTFEPLRETLDLGALFATTARLDLARTLAEARTLKDEVVRGNMLFAAARAVLQKDDKRDAKHAP